MFKLALRTVFAKKLRFIGTALSITLGIAFLAGTLVFTDTMGRTFDDLFADIYADTDTVVRASSDIEDQMGFAVRGRIPDSTVDLVAGVDGVAQAVGFVQGFAQIVGSDGDVIGNPSQGPPTFGGNYISGALGPWVLTEGSTSPGAGDVVIDVGSAKEGGLEIGDEITVLTQSGAHQLQLVGTARFGSIDSPGGANVSLFDLATAQELLLGDTGEIDTVLVDAEPGVGEDELTNRITAALPDGQEALTGSAIVEEQQDMMAKAMGFFETFLLVFAIIGLVVACFTIFNTFQIVITQRIHEMALLRAIGATRMQVLTAQLLEALVVGVTASLVGLVLGVVVAGLLQAMLEAFGIDMPSGGTVFLPRTAVIALLVGTAVTVGSAVFPALRASRIPPIAALRDVALERTGQERNRLTLGGGLTALGAVGFVVGLTGSGIMWVGLGALAMFLGAFVLGPSVARLVGGLISAPLPPLTGITGQLARENAMRNPKRTARTGGALMVGVALVVGINIIAVSVKDWIRDVVDAQFEGDYVVSANTIGYGGLSTELAAGLNAVSDVEAATGIRIGFARLLGDTPSDEPYTAVDPATASRVFDIGVVSGAVEELDDQGVFVDDDEAEARNLTVGDVLTFGFLNGQTRQLTVRGLFTEDELAGNFVVNHELHEWTGVDQFDLSVYIALVDGVSEEAARPAIAALTDPYANADLLSRDEYLDQQSSQIDPLVNVMYALLALAIGIALFSIANSMALSIHERTREIGLLRAVGMTRAQLRSTVRWESVLVALLGTGTGLVLGVFFGWAISVTVRGDGLTAFALPVLQIVVIGVLAVVGALLAATRPAWRGARLDVLQAISTE
jgi:putative ABC transport system permease protein